MEGINYQGEREGPDSRVPPKSFDPFKKICARGGFEVSYYGVPHLSAAFQALPLCKRTYKELSR